MSARFSELGFFDATIEFSGDVIEKLLAHRQNFGKSEAGGMLFCHDLNSPVTQISEISFPTKLDIRKKSFFKQDECFSQNIIEANFARGLHYVGDWHTHSQVKPVASNRDLLTIKSIYNKSDHSLRFMVHVIVPNSDNFSDSYVALTDGVVIRRCVSIVDY